MSTPQLPENFAHRIFKVFKASFDFEKTVKIIKAQYFKSASISQVKKIVANQLRTHYKVLIDDDGTYIQDPPSTPNEPIDLMAVIKNAKGVKEKMPKKKDEDDSSLESKAIDVAESSNEVKKFERNHSDCMWSVEKLSTKKAKSYLDGGKTPKLWVVEIEAIEKELMKVIINPVTQKIVDITTTDLKPDTDEDGTDLGKIEGMTSDTREKLLELGIMSVEDLAEAQLMSDDLEEVDLDEDTFDQSAILAQDYLAGKAKKGKKAKNPKKRLKDPSPPSKKEKKHQSKKEKKLPPHKSPKSKKDANSPKAKKPSTPSQPPVPASLDPPSVDEILSKEEQGAFNSILEVDMGEGGEERGSSFGEMLASLVSDDEGQRLSVLPRDDPKVPQPHSQQISTKPPQPVSPPSPRPVPPVQHKEPPPPKEHTSTVSIFPPVEDVIRSSSALHYPSVVNSLRRKFHEPPEIY